MMSTYSETTKNEHSGKNEPLLVAWFLLVVLNIGNH